MAVKPLNQTLFDEPQPFEFFQAVRLLEKIMRDRKPVGGSALPAEEVARFRSRISLNFPASEIHELRDVESDGGRTVELHVNFMGVAGVNGALPVHYTELLLNRISHRDTALWSFLDMFTHRTVSLFYRAWRKYRFPVAYESGDDQFTASLFDLAGLGTSGLRGRMGLPDESLLPYTGLIAQKPHSVNALENVLSDYFGTGADVLQFFGQWITLESSDTTRLGAKNSALGITAIAGTRVWDQQSKFRVQLGPMQLKQFQAFLPNGSAYKPLRSIIRFMVGTEVDFDVQLKLQAKQVPSTVLTTRAMRRPMLGWTSFLKTQPFNQDDEQVTLAME